MEFDTTLLARVAHCNQLAWMKLYQTCRAMREQLRGIPAPKVKLRGGASGSWLRTRTLWTKTVAGHLRCENGPAVVHSDRDIFSGYMKPLSVEYHGHPIIRNPNGEPVHINVESNLFTGQPTFCITNEVEPRYIFPASKNWYSVIYEDLLPYSGRGNFTISIPKLEQAE